MAYFVKKSRSGTATHLTPGTGGQACCGVRVRGAAKELHDLDADVSCSRCLRSIDAQSIRAATAGGSYRLGWEWSGSRSDLDAAEDEFLTRFAIQWSSARHDAFCAGWLDYAADNPFSPPERLDAVGLVPQVASRSGE